MSMRADVVYLTCGDADLGDRWNCVKAEVTNGTGRPVAPITYKSGPSVYHNALGATWTVRRVEATYPIAPLIDGFTVVVAGDEGTAYSENVSKDKADDELLFTLPMTHAERVAVIEKAAAAS